MGLFYFKSPLMKKGMSKMFVDVKIVFVLYLQNQLMFSSFEILNLHNESLFLKWEYSFAQNFIRVKAICHVRF
jgi:hypothetical protein